jgi:2-hydroxychromene-2-carboxylate isomerase
VQITAYLSIGSTYTFLTALRLRGVVEREGLDLRFRPFSVRAIMREMNNIPFPPEKEAKVRYMWRDIERRAGGYGLPAPTVPAPYPLKDFDRANHVGVIAEQQGWYLDYFEATYRAWFVDGVEAGSDENIRRVCEQLGHSYEDVSAAAAAPEADESYRANTEAAKAAGVFGAPSFTVGDEVFWGDDRLEDAIAFSRG